MPVVPLAVTALKWFAAFWSLVVMAVAAAFLDKAKDGAVLVAFSFGVPLYGSYKTGPAGALVAAAVLSLIYFVAICILAIVASQTIVLSVLVDTVALSFLFIFFLGATAALSRHASFFSDNSGVTWCQLGSAAIGLGWVMTFLILAILLLETIYTLLHFGSDYPTWRSSFTDLFAYGAPKTRGAAGISGGAGVSGGAGEAEKGAVPMQSVAGAQAGAGAGEGAPYAGPATVAGGASVPAPAAAATPATAAPQATA
ncbi:hypothetical protein IAT38_007347 [Cryptococcus sp. DSM 104549]